MRFLSGRDGSSFSGRDGSCFFGPRRISFSSPRRIFFFGRDGSFFFRTKTDLLFWPFLASDPCVLVAQQPQLQAAVGGRCWRACSSPPSSSSRRDRPWSSTPGAPSCPPLSLRRRRARETLCCRRGRGAQAQRAGQRPSPCRSCAQPTALSPWTACCRTSALWRAAATRGSPASICCPCRTDEATSCPKWILEPASLSQKVTNEFREGAPR